MNLLREVDGSRVAAANQNGDALAGSWAVTLREQGCEGCRPSRLGYNAQHSPQGDLRLPNFVGTPHIGGGTREAVLAMGRAAMQGLEAGPSSLDLTSNT